jgi:hypothetical protein
LFHVSTQSERRSGVIVDGCFRQIDWLQAKQMQKELIKRGHSKCSLYTTEKNFELLNKLVNEEFLRSEYCDIDYEDDRGLIILSCT